MVYSLLFSIMFCIDYASSHIFIDLFFLLLGNWPNSYILVFHFVDDKFMSHDPMEAVL